MARAARRFRNGVFALGIAVAPGFGAHEALADVRGRTCADPGIGCGTRSTCLKSCAEAFPFDDVVDARCSGGCCHCELARA